MSLRDRTISGTPFSVREYQRQAAESFYACGSARAGSGVVVLPCGAGKTIVGLAAMEMVGQTTLVLATSLTSVKQWRREICDKTSLLPDEITQYTGEQKSTGPVTLTTYQILTWRSDRESDFPHLGLFRARSWGLIIYDEVHLLPAPVFRATADLQARRRLGLTPHWSEKTTAKGTCSHSSGQNGSKCPGEISNVKTGSPAPRVWKSSFP